MKQINAHEFKDLSKEIQEKVKNRITNEYIEINLDILWSDPLLTESEKWIEIGCSKSYGESTSWFVPSVYYEKHIEEVDKAVNAYLESGLFDRLGNEITL